LAHWAIFSQNRVLNSAWITEKHFSVNPFLSFFFASSSLFFFQSTLAPHYKRLALYTATLNNERMVTLFSLSCPSFALPRNLTLLHHCSFFLVDRMG
jgi:hypothetical protein